MIIKTCDQCGKEVKVPPSKEQRQQRTFCSNDCYNAARSVTLTCRQCGKEFHAFKSVADRKRFCSKACQLDQPHYSEKVERDCTVCGKKFTTTLSQSMRTCSKECAAIGRRRRSPEMLKPKVKKTCEICGKDMELFASRAYRRFCSNECRAAGVSIDATGKIRTSQIVQCLYCGKPVKKYRCRVKASERQFCNNECYHAWDSLYKASPEMVSKLSERLSQGFGKISKPEEHVAQWLHDHDLSFEQQSVLKWYSMDFKVGDIYIEVQGCYWHGCPDCFSELTPKQRKQQGRDKSKATYCRKRNIKLVTIWEHDIKRKDFSALSPLLQ